MKLELANIYDPIGHKITQIPKCELAVGMIRVKIQGIDEACWIDGVHLKSTYAPKHPPFKGDMKAKIEEICRCLYEVFPKTYKQWEDGFRADTHPQNEINLWFSATQKFQKVTEKKYYTLLQKMDIFKILVNIMMSGGDADFVFPDLSILDKSEAHHIMNQFLSGNERRG